MNSQQLFEAVYERHANAIKGFAMRRIDPARADDVVAEVFLVAWRRLEDMPDEPRPWLFGVATRVLANERRRTARQHAALDRLEPVAASVDPAESPALADRPLQEALRNLSEADRALGVKEATFTVRLHRAKRRLGRAIERSEPVRAQPTRLETQ
jgi:RNA polymerase sigma-70 factor (ECF subfamily)